jgi:oligosaccharide repeat unit polymerase
MYIRTNLVFLVLSILYGFSFLILHSIPGAEVVSFQTVSVDGNNSGPIFLIIIQSIFGFYLGLKLSGFLKYEKEIVRFSLNEVGKNNVHFALTLYFQFFVTMLLILLTTPSELMSYLAGYSAAVEVRSSSSVFVYLFMLAISTCSAILGKELFQGRYVRASIISGFLLLTFLISGDKNILLLFLLGCGFGFGFFIYKYKFTQLLLLFLGAILIILFSRVFSLYRGGAEIGVSIVEGVVGFNYSQIDGAGPFWVFNSVLDNYDDYSLGSTYLLELKNLIPRFIYPGDRPETLSEEFSRENMINWFPGAGFGYSPFAEAYVNFGIVGGFLGFLIFGLVWGFFWKFVIRNSLKLFSALQYSHILLLYCVIGFNSLFLTFRGTSLSFIKILIQFFVPLLISAVIVKIVMFSTKRPQSIFISKISK